MSKNNHDEPKEEVTEHLSEWQKRNKEYLEKKAQAEAEKQKEAEEAAAEEGEEAAAQAEEGMEKADREAEEDEVESEAAAEEAKIEELFDEAAQAAEAEPELTEKERKKLEKLQKKAEKATAKAPIARVHLYRALPVLLGSTLLFLLSLYFLTPLATMKTLEFSGNQAVDQETLLQSSRIDDRDYTLTTLLNQSNYARNMKASSPWIEQVDMTYQFPVTFQVTVKEYAVLAYLHDGGQYYPILTNGQVIEQAAAADSLPETYLAVEFTDRGLIKEFAQQMAKISDVIKKNIKTVQLTPSKVTSDLLTLTMYDGNKILVPIAHISKKLPYYKGIQPQLEAPSVVDMEAGIFSYAEGAEAQGEETASDSATDTGTEQPAGEEQPAEESQEDGAAAAQNSAENTGNTENR
ncbi:Cell division protein FtsQ [Streptococcus sp. DD11]|uniref:cell division protein FtsQ/DivIB n=1 Tax=Streptococcus sp. DD11 TaxID=1777879 RepID=UPI00079C1173|nr:FtsQ-type POTRA domain-containing protein [Streptococcus sp. DD11]KXT81664.1 Cell division protein FtsQ [Streptococcus sp. DD11]